MATKYALPEIERRWFVDLAKVGSLGGLEFRAITDRFLDGTQLRLRRVQKDDVVVFKLGKKYVGEMTNIYLSEAEYLVLAELPATVLSKTRYSLDGGSLDVPLDSPLQPRWEREFATWEEAKAFVPPAFVLDEDS